MNIEFTAMTNSIPPMINTAKFQLPNGNEITIDRDSTEYSYVEISPGAWWLEMRWCGCYVWDGEDASYFQDDSGLPEGTEFVELELEDDAGENYYVDVKVCRF